MWGCLFIHFILVPRWLTFNQRIKLSDSAKHHHHHPGDSEIADCMRASEPDSRSVAGTVRTQKGLVRTSDSQGCACLQTDLQLRVYTEPSS